MSDASDDVKDAHFAKVAALLDDFEFKEPRLDTPGKPKSDIVLAAPPSPDIYDRYQDVCRRLNEATTTNQDLSRENDRLRNEVRLICSSMCSSNECRSRKQCAQPSSCISMYGQLDYEGWDAALFNIQDQRERAEKAEKDRDEARTECERLKARQQELLATIVRVTNETPFADEATDALKQRGILVAEIGSLKDALRRSQEDWQEMRDERDEARAECERMRLRNDGLVRALTEANTRVDGMRPVFEAAKAWRAVFGTASVDEKRKALAAAIDHALAAAKGEAK